MRKILEEAQGAYHLAQCAREEAQRELAQIIEDINAARPMLVTAEAKLTVLKAKDHAMREGLDEIRTQKAQLTAELKGMEREREQTQGLLERMTKDRKTLQDFSDAVQVNARDLGQAAKEAEAAAKKFSTVATDLGASSGVLKTGATDITAKIKDLEAQIAQLTARNQALTGTLERDEKIRRDLKGQVDLLTGAASALNQAGKEIDGQVRKWSQQSDKTLTEVGRLEQALTPLPKNLDVALKSLSGATDGLNAQVKALESQTTAVRTIVGPLQTQARDFYNTTKMLQDEAGKTQKSGETLVKQMDELRQSVEAARELMKTVSDSLPSQTTPPSDKVGAVMDQEVSLAVADNAPTVADEAVVISGEAPTMANEAFAPAGRTSAVANESSATED